MFDFLKVVVEQKKDYTLVKPEFVVKGRIKDLMIRGSSFYAIWDYENNIWTNDEYRAIELIDCEIRKVVDDINSKYLNVRPKYLSDTDNGMIVKWGKFTEKILPDNYKPLNTKIIFKSEEAKREDYVTKKAEYDLVDGDISAYKKAFSVLFSETELTKLEWAIGAILSGDVKKIQKFIVLYGGPGTGKSSYLKYVVQEIFKGYYTVFNAKDIGNGNLQFSMEPFKNYPLVAIQHDGDLSRIMDNTKLNSIISHEEMLLNEKHKPQYKVKLNTFLFMGTNEPVDITGSKSGMNRRLIDVRPTGNKIAPDKFDKLMNRVLFETGAIAKHCVDVYNKLGKDYYNNYIPSEMKIETDDFYNFIEEDYYSYIKGNWAVSAREIWGRYRKFCEDRNIKYVYSYTQFISELKEYFRDFKKDYYANGGHLRNVFFDFRKSKIGLEDDIVEVNDGDSNSTSGSDWLQLSSSVSIFDSEFGIYPAQYANKEGIPGKGWDYIHTTLSDIDSTKLHFVRPPENLIVIDFDIKNDKGEKDKELNKLAAESWPPTYAEYSKGGGLHLHYIYDGDVNELSNRYSDDVEIKVFTGKASLRRKLSFCNELSIAHLSTGLPLREEEKKVLDFEGFKNEKALRKFILDCIAKKHHGATKPEVDFIFKKLEECYKSGMHYDVRDMYNKILAFALGSTNQKDACIKLVNKMQFKSDDISDGVEAEAPIIFLDIEVFPNLLLVCWKFRGDDKKVVRMFNPTPQEVEELFKFRIIGYNNRRYDNHILYGRSMGYNEYQCYILSKNIILGGKGNRDAFISEAYNISYADVYDFATKKQSLKKWEIELDLPHKECEHDWNADLPEEYWEEVADYCCNDVIATEKVFEYKDVQADFRARQILADISGLTVNDTTNMHTTKIIVGNDRNPQSSYIYTNLATGERSDGTFDKVKFPGYRYSPTKIEVSEYKPGVKIVSAHSIYKGLDPSEGGFAIGFPGAYIDVALLDVKSMHPTSLEQLNAYGPYTERFSEIKRARIAIKEGRFDDAKEMFDGKLSKYLDNTELADELAYALKIAINSVYGLTSATFDNKLKDPRNIDNIVAKRGALFMIDLKEAVEKEGYKVVHIKTDSIKIANADNYIIKFVMDFGLKYGYEFDHEATYDRMCIVNDAVYIAKYATAFWCENKYGYVPKDCKKHENKWTATGKEFQVPYIFKTLFSGEDLELRDFSVVNSVSTAMYLDMSNGSNDSKDFIFIGKVGNFIPVKKEVGGTLLCKREDKEGNVKYDAVQGTKGYYWLEYDTVKELGYKDLIDQRYFDTINENAIKHINQYVKFEEFISDAPFTIMDVSIVEDDEVPFR